VDVHGAHLPDRDQGVLGGERTSLVRGTVRFTSTHHDRSLVFEGPRARAPFATSSRTSFGARASSVSRARA
jgi:hypothetical protein